MSELTSFLKLAMEFIKNWSCAQTDVVDVHIHTMHMWALTTTLALHHTHAVLSNLTGQPVTAMALPLFMIHELLCLPKGCLGTFNF